VFFFYQIFDYVLLPIVAAVFRGRIPFLAPQLQKFSMKDHVFQFINKLCAATFVLASIRYVLWQKSKVSLDVSTAALKQSAVAALWQVPTMFVIYDFFYTLFHWALHLKWIYGWIHKHHHRQMSPFRGFTDAINVHPFEFLVGDYNHLLALFILTRIPVVGEDVHAFTYIFFVLFGGLLASLNHTRTDCHVLWGTYDVKYHDMHHRMPDCNFGQYIMLWDKVFGTFLPYREKIVQ
jgi:sterol desaturase/sphingolipid hydroxylase (fatty acid hydroxylase superfamily)